MSLSYEAASNVPTEQRTLAIQFYNAARAETVQRLSLREQGLFAFLTAVGIIIGLTTKTSGAAPYLDCSVLAILPALAAAFATGITRHSRLIGYLSEFIREELNAALDQPVSHDVHEYPHVVRHWDNSAVLHTRIDAYLRQEEWVYSILLCGPALFAIYMTWSSSSLWLILFNVLCILWSLGLLWRRIW